MQVVYTRCCGLDVHKKSVVACVLITEPDGTMHRRVRTFSTMTADLLALDDWFRQLEVVTVGHESTGTINDTFIVATSRALVGRCMSIIRPLRTLCKWSWDLTDCRAGNNNPLKPLP